MAKRIMPTFSTLASFGAATCIATLMSCLAWAQPIAEISEHLRPPSAFSGIIDRAARSRALFAEAAKVITSPRCMNCHPAGDHPTQGNDEHVHQPAATRGSGGRDSRVGMRGVPHRQEFSARRRHKLPKHSWSSAMGIGTPGDGMAGKSVCGDLPSDQGSRPQRWTQSRFAPRAYGEGRLGGLGMASRSGPSAGSGDTGRIWCDHSGVDRKWGGMPLTLRTFLNGRF